MDPVIHCSVAAVAARLVLGEGRTRSPARDGFVIATAILAGLAPDADQLCHPFPPETGGLSYMLYHRGATHTVLACLALGLALGAVIWLASRLLRPAWRPSLRDLVVTAVLGTELHLLFDGFVDYGVHPFWPWNAWVYGDFLFLSEPLLWLALSPAVLAWLVSLLPVRQSWLRIALTLAGPLFAVGWTWRQALQPIWVLPGAAVVVTLWGAAMMFVYRRDRSPRIAALAALLVLVVFFGASRFAKARALAELAKVTPNEDIRQVVTTATAANPFCWRVVVSSYAEGGQKVVVRMGALSFWSLSDARDCVISNRKAPPNLPNLPWHTGSDAASAAFNWFGTFEDSTSSFFELAANNCRARATRHFLRAPFWVKKTDGKAIIGDLRLDYERDAKRYAKYTFDQGEKHGCDTLRVPPWTPPFFDSNP